jgi:glucose/arabinose dehydrogenase
MRRTFAVALALILCAGCGARHHTARATPSKLAQAQATHEYPSPPSPPQTATGAKSTAAQAIRAFATAYINWTAQTVAGDMASLAARSVGQARSAMSLAAAQTADDYELKRGGIANQGTVEAVAPLPRHRDQYLVVTLESTSATNTTAYRGLRPAWHVALATVTELQPGQWVLSAWQPEN